MKDKKQQMVVYGILIAFALFYTFQNICNPLFNSLNFSDGSIYQYIGHLITIGKMPYTDAFDHKGPILYLINAIGCLIDNHWGIWLVDVVFMVGVLVVSLKTCQKFSNITISLITTLIIISDLTHSYWIGNIPDYYSLFFLMVSYYMLIDFYERGDLQNIQVFIVGICAAMIFWMKYTNIFPICILCFCILCNCFTRKNFKQILRYMAWFLAGFIIPTFVIACWLAHNGAWNAMVTDYFTFNLSYASHSNENYSKLLALKKFLYFPAIGVTIIEIVASWMLRQMRSKNNLLIVSQICFGTSILVSILPGRDYAQYAIMLYPPILIISILIAKELQLLTAEKKYSRLLMLIWIGLEVYFIFVPNLRETIDNQIYNLEESATDTQIVELIGNNTGAQDVIAVASPDDCGFYLATGLESATTYPYIQADLYSDAEFWHEYIAELDSQKPKVIVWAKNWSADLISSVLDKYNMELETDKLQIYVRYDE